MGTYKIAGILLIVGAVFVISGVLADYIVAETKDTGKHGVRERSMITSGLPPQARRILLASTAIALLCTAVLIFYIEKLDGSLTSEKHVVRLKRLCRAYRYSLLAASMLAAAQIVFALLSLLNLPQIRFAHILHSKVTINTGVLLVSVSMLLFYRRYMRKIRNAPVAVILAAKRNTTVPKQ